jgi:hypothetical protein
MKKIFKIINMFFGMQPKKRFNRLIILLLLILLSTFVLLNISYNKKDGVKITPSAEIKINKGN